MDTILPTEDAMNRGGIFTDLSFSKGYRVALLSELPGREVSNVFFIPPIGMGGKDGVLIEVSPENGEQWIACCAFGQFGIGISAVIAAPQPAKIFVVAEGQGYVIDSKCRSEWHDVPCRPIADLRVAPDRGVVLFSDFTSICAYGLAGRLWKSKQLCWDELKIEQIEGNKILGNGYDPTNSEKPYGQFELDLFTGEVRKSDFEYAYKQNLFGEDAR